MEVILGDIIFFMKQATCALAFFLSIRSGCAQPLSCPKEKIGS